jgi:phosphosulfolactate phosphohydrolase-like enzyme
MDAKKHIHNPPGARTVSVLFEPSARAALDLGGATAVVIDAIRATTTIVAALVAGAREVRPYRTAEEVRAEAARRPADTVVTAGERKGVRIEGLDLNNSPSVMTPDRVGGRTLLLTTTNGTQAILDAMPAETILLAALPNRRAVAARVARLGRRVVFVAAGTVGTVSCEDTLVAGAVIEAMTENCGLRIADCGLKEEKAPPSGRCSAVNPQGVYPPGRAVRDPQLWHLEDSALVALAAWRGARHDLAAAFRRTWGGAFIENLGLGADLDVCTTVDSTDVVPVVRGEPPVIVAE